jgi:hypothetical protein
MAVGHLLGGSGGSAFLRRFDAARLPDFVVINGTARRVDSRKVHHAASLREQDRAMTTVTLYIDQQSKNVSVFAVFGKLGLKREAHTGYWFSLSRQRMRGEIWRDEEVYS